MRLPVPEKKFRQETEIYKKYRQGMKVQELAEQFYLSEKSIQRIVLQEKKLAQRNKNLSLHQSNESGASD